MTGIGIVIDQEALDQVQLTFECENHSSSQFAVIHPSFFADAGLPICGECGDDMVISQIALNI